MFFWAKLYDIWQTVSSPDIWYVQLQDQVIRCSSQEEAERRVQEAKQGRGTLS
jgi:hypothetical protein